MDERHPGFDHLKPDDKAKFRELKQIRSTVGATPNQIDSLEKLLGAMQLKSAPFDLSHEGVHNLLPKDLLKFKELSQKQPALTSEEQ